MGIADLYYVYFYFYESDCTNLQALNLVLYSAEY